LNIIKTPSPNFDNRTLPVSLLVLHYTGMESGAAALERLCDPEAKVSAHYMVGEDGNVTQLVDEHKRAWHAGVSEWQGERDINSASIGIEIVNGGHDYPDAQGALPLFPEVQIDIVIALSHSIIAQYGPLTLLGHSDIAPDRKKDPGEHFPWVKLAAAGLGYWPQNITHDRRILFEPGARDRGISIIQRGLAHIGYSARITGVFDGKTQHIIQALQRRYRPDQIDGMIDVQTMEIVKALAEYQAIA